MTVAAPVAEAKTVSKAEWAKGFCSAVKDWQTSVTKAHSLVDDVVDQRVATLVGGKSSQKKIVSALGAASKGRRAQPKR